jgi:uncharacterized membrane protein HdeD (DUF308 family)
MVDPSRPDLAALRNQAAAAVQAHSTLFIVQGALMMVLGGLAIALPNISTLAIELLIGWLFLLGGALRVAAVWRTRHLHGFGWSLSISILAILLGLVLLLGPAQGALTLTIVLVAFFIVEGVVAILLALEFRRHLRHWTWTLLSGVVDLLLAYLIWQGWPVTATWAIGLLVGINMLFLGWSLVMTAIAARTLSQA